MSRDLNLQCNVKVGIKAGNINVKKKKLARLKHGVRVTNQT